MGATTGRAPLSLRRIAPPPTDAMARPAGPLTSSRPSTGDGVRKAALLQEAGHANAGHVLEAVEDHLQLQEAAPEVDEPSAQAGRAGAQ